MVFADVFSWNAAKKKSRELERTNPKNPVLNEEDEHFLHQVASKDAPPALLPPSDTTAIDPQAELAKDTQIVSLSSAGAAAEESFKDSPSNKRTWASYVPSVPAIPSVPRWPAMKSMKKLDETAPDDETKVYEKLDDQHRQAAYPAGVKVIENIKVGQTEASDPKDKETDNQKEVTVLLDKLNLSSINNKVFAFSDQTQKICQDFTIVLKDMINGAPTAYDDMERLLKDNDGHLSDMFANMPPFVQTLVKSLPSTVAPAILSAASGNPDPDAELKTKVQIASAPAEAKPKEQKKNKIINLEKMSRQKGVVASMLANVVNFLKVRFPLAVTGTNVVMSMAVLIMLFVMFYCHKRGRETRLDKSAPELSDESAADAADEEAGEVDEKEGISGMPSEEVEADREKPELETA